MENVVYTVLAFLLVSQVFSFALHYLHSPRQVQRAFSNLEDDFEELRDHVASQLGRISRLRRATLEATRDQAPPEESTITEGGFALTPRQKKLQAEILARRGERNEKTQ
jgi:hypothetical protein